MNNRLFKITLFCLLSFFISCKSTTHIDSHDINNTEDRIKILSENIYYGSSFYDAEFSLFNVNGFPNSRSFDAPGASSYYYEFVVKINPDSVNNWLNSFTEINSINTDLTWKNKLIDKRPKPWKTTSSPKYYTKQNGNTIIIYYPKDGILFKSISNL